MNAAELTLGPVTEERLRAAFADKAVVGRGVVCDLLGLDPKTVDTLTDARVLGSIPKGAKQRGYTERNLREYLTRPPDPESRPQPKPRARSAPANVRHVNFSERRGCP